MNPDDLDRFISPRVPMMRTTQRPARPSFRVFRVEGSRGETKRIHERNYDTFKPTELFATDTSLRAGHGSAISTLYIGNWREFPQSQQPSEPIPIPTWMFEQYILPEERPALEVAAARMDTDKEDAEARQAAARLRFANAAARYPWKTWNGGIDIMIEIYFRQPCAWEAVFWGQELR